jgi:hypothetical protein
MAMPVLRSALARLYWIPTNFGCLVGGGGGDELIFSLYSFKLHTDKVFFGFVVEKCGGIILLEEKNYIRLLCSVLSLFKDNILSSEIVILLKHYTNLFYSVLYLEHPYIHKINLKLTP